LIPLMTETRPPADADVPAPVPGRGQPRLEFGFRRFRASLLLRGSAVLAFVSYGGLAALVITGRLPFGHAAMVALLSLASWFFLFWWYPVMERTVATLDSETRRRVVGGILEGIASVCVLLVHVLLAIIVVTAAGRS
jgi:hypothetical protein